MLPDDQDSNVRSTRYRAGPRRSAATIFDDERGGFNVVGRIAANTTCGTSKRKRVLRTVKNS